jgi:hypothetical protein
MNDVLLVVGLVALWVVVQRVLLPRMGVPT